PDGDALDRDQRGAEDLEVREQLVVPGAALDGSQRLTVGAGEDGPRETPHRASRAIDESALENKGDRGFWPALPNNVTVVVDRREVALVDHERSGRPLVVCPWLLSPAAYRGARGGAVDHGGNPRTFLAQPVVDAG